MKWKEIIPCFELIFGISVVVPTLAGEETRRVEKPAVEPVSQLIREQFNLTDF